MNEAIEKAEAQRDALQIRVERLAVLVRGLSQYHHKVAAHAGEWATCTAGTCTETRVALTDASL